MARQRHHSASPYEPIAGYCRALRDGNRILVSGTAPIGPDGENVGLGDPYKQAKRCIEVIREGIEALGGRLSDVIRTRAYLTRADDWEAVGRAHGEAFADHPPVTSFIVVAKLLHEDWLVEIEAEAVIETC